MVDAILNEAYMREGFLDTSGPLQSLYFGGGTPSVLSPPELSRLIQGLKKTYPLASSAEITLEANPDDLTEAYLGHLLESGVNRLSIGTQSFREQDLRWMNRSHNAAQAIQSVKWAQNMGLNNISIDLIFGIPNMDLNVWKTNLEQAVSLDIPHLSVYALTVEEKTALDAQVRKGKVLIPQDEAYKEQFLLAHEYLESAGYQHYELSNYAKPGKQAVHNSNYWNRVPYLGLGPSAHGFDGKTRYWNRANNSQYLKSLSKLHLPTEDEEFLSDLDHYHEYLMTHLRRDCGIDARFIQKNWISNWEKQFSSLLQRYISEGLMQQIDGRYVLSAEGWIVSDRITADFFFDE